MKDQLADDDDAWPSLCHNPSFEQYMPFSRGGNLRHFFSEILLMQQKKKLIIGISFLW
jgi:hypothetical protein